MNTTQPLSPETPINVPTSDGQTLHPAGTPSPIDLEGIEKLAIQPTQEEQLQQKIAQLEAELTIKKEDALRMAAEVENVRKRSQDEVSKVSKFAIERFAESLIPVIDSLEAASLDNSSNIEMLKKGVDLTLSQLLNAFERSHLKAIAPTQGQAYDPHLHQAISMVESEQEPNTVVSSLQKGYEISGRVLRPSMVTVSKPKAAQH